jgi:hypothetical protein
MTARGAGSKVFQAAIDKYDRDGLTALLHAVRAGKSPTLL